MKLQGYFSTDWTHLWLPYKGRMNQIRVDNEAHMKHMVTELEGKNKPISFSHTTLGNCFLEVDHGCYTTQPSSFQEDEQSKLLHCTQTDANDCKIVEVDDFCFTNSIIGTDIWTLFFDGSRSQEGVGQVVY
jgi:hypothetical protein